MLRTDSLKGRTPRSSLNPVQRIRAQNVHIVRPGQQVAEYFHLNCGFSAALLTKQINQVIYNA